MKEKLKEIFELADSIYVSTATVGSDLGIPAVADDAQRIKRLVNTLERAYGFPQSRVAMGQTQ